MASTRGWVKLHRKVMDSAIWSDPLRLKAFFHLVMVANRKDGEWFERGQVVKVKRGQKITSLRSLANEWGCSKDTVKRILNQFKELDMIDYQTETRGWTVLTVKNYGVYQGDADSDRDSDKDTDKDTHKDTDKDTDTTQTRIYKNNKNNKKRKEEASALPEEEEDEDDAWWKELPDEIEYNEADWIGGGEDNDG